MQQINGVVKLKGNDEHVCCLKVKGHFVQILDPNPRRNSTENTCKIPDEFLFVYNY